MSMEPGSWGVKAPKGRIEEAKELVKRESCFYSSHLLIGSVKTRSDDRIWEKKYGKNAKHVVKAREAEKTKEREKKFGPSDKGWGSKPRPEASTPQTDAKADNAVRPKSFTSSQPAAQSEKPVPTPKAEGALHPSWEAARLRKQKAMGVGAPKPQKIVFD